jgi:hypothetical protein
MGHFSYTCHLSGVPITDGDNAVLLPMLPKPHWGFDCSQKKLTTFGLSNLCSNDGPNMYFDEFFFPIFGIYDSYGGLDNITKDDNTSVLEEYFNLSIEDIVKVLTDHRKDEFESGGTYCECVKIIDKNNPKHMLLMKASSTWFHGKVYDRLSKDVTKQSKYGGVELGTHGILTTLGFKYLGIDKSENRYNKLYEKDGLTIHSDGTWINVPKESIYYKEDLKKYCKKFGVEIDETLITGNRYSQLYDYVLPTMNGIKEFSNNRDLTYMLLGDQSAVKSYQFEVYETLIYDESIPKEKVEEVIKLREELISNNITLFYYTKIIKNGNNFLKQNILDWFAVKKYYYPTGRFLYPVGTAAQDGDFKNVKKLLETALSVVNEELIERDYDEDENEDEDY